jgi:hypothetical protein
VIHSFPHRKEGEGGKMRFIRVDPLRDYCARYHLQRQLVAVASF